MKTLVHLTPLAMVGGCEVNCLRLVKALPDFSHRVLVFDEKGPMTAQWERAGALVEHLGTWQQGPSRFGESLKTWVRQSARPEGVFYWSASRLPQILEMIDEWASPAVVHLGNPFSPSKNLMVRRWVAEQFRRSRDGVVLAACSNHVAESHRDAPFFRQFPMRVIYNPVEGEPAVRRVQRVLPSGARPRLGMVARLDSIKDHATVLAALALLASMRPDATLEFAGDGPLRETLEAQARALGVENRVRFLGFVDVAPVLKSWDLYIHSTTPAEGMGTAVAEAMMAGLPCIVSDLPVMREVCAEAAMYFKPGDAESLARVIVETLDNQPMRDALAAAGVGRAQRLFSLDTVAQRYIEALALHKERALV